MKKIFDGTQEEFDNLINFENQIFLNISVNNILQKSNYLLESHKLAHSLAIKNIIHADKMGSFNGPENLSVYYFNLNSQNTMIFEFGEKQPGRYILNQLAIIEE